VTFATVFADTFCVVNANEVEELPALMNTHGGGVSAGESLERVTAAPPGGA
jgi:hypothetical protein